MRHPCRTASIQYPKDMNSDLKKKALTKALVFWKEPINGRDISTFYSLDKPHALQEGNHLPGMARLVKKIVEPNIGKFKRVIIYRNNENNNGEELRRYNSEGKES